MRAAVPWPRIRGRAGSGKTRVLTERLMGYICDDAHPVDLGSFPIITFTRAPPQRLRGRIMEELPRALPQTPAAAVCSARARCAADAQIAPPYQLLRERPA